MSDLIDRQAAIEAIKDLESSDDFGFNNGLICAMNRIAELPSSQPERKEGSWIRKSNWMWTCSCCGKDDAYAYSADDAYEPTVLQDFFCPNCGAKMKE